MIGVGVIMFWAFYGVGSYGWVLVKGYDITARQWFSPLNPYTWPAPGETIPRVPLGHLFPTGTAGPGAPGSNSTGGGAPPAHKRQPPVVI